MNDIERRYRVGIAAWSGQQRVQRSAALLAEMRELPARKVAAVDPSLDRATVSRRVAECLYRTDRETRRLLAILDR